MHEDNPDELYRRYHAGKYPNDKDKVPTPDPKEGPDRKVDVFAKPESLADKLRKRRKKVESGNLEEYE